MLQIDDRSSSLIQDKAILQFDLILLFHLIWSWGLIFDYCFSKFFLCKATIWELERDTVVKAFAEFLGTGFLLFIGCLTAVGSMTVNPRPEHLTAFNMGLVVNGIILVRITVTNMHVHIHICIGMLIIENLHRSVKISFDSLIYYPQWK